MILKNYMSTAKEIGIIILPDDNTSLEAEKIKNTCLKNLESAGIINADQYAIIYQNIFHLTLFQLKIYSENLSKIYRILENIAANIKKINFRMNNELTGMQHHIFWNSNEAKNLVSLRKLQEDVITNTKELRVKTMPFDRLQNKQLTEEEKKAVEEFGVFWGLSHNFIPHMTIVYNSVTRENKIKIQHCLRDIKIKNLQLFRSKSLAIGELGYSGNVLSLLETIKLAG